MKEILKCLLLRMLKSREKEHKINFFYLEMCQEKRSAKFKQAKKYAENIRELKASKENVDSVNSGLTKLIKFYEEASDSFIKLSLPVGV